MDLIDRIFSIECEESFTEIALEVFQFQRRNCPIYTSFVDSLNWPEPSTIAEIPFLPIEFFKSHQIISKGVKRELLFKSSGTGGTRSEHHVAFRAIYENSFRRTFSNFIGNPADMTILALLPNYIEQGESSLIYMVRDLVNTSSAHSAFILDNVEGLKTKLFESKSDNKQIVLFGVSYALLDICDQELDLSNVIIIETGGMKGRRKELTKEELHQTLKTGLNNPRVFSEYGMTELLSQAYCKEDLIFKSSPWFKVMIRDTNDPFQYLKNGKTGGINAIDLANLYSCSFVATQDLGRKTNGGFEVLGRFDNADIRGCNLLVQ